VGGPWIELQERPGQQHPGAGQQPVQAELLAAGEPGPDPAAAAVVDRRGQGTRGGEHHLGDVVRVGGQVGGGNLPAPGVADQHQPLGADPPADGLQVGHLTGDVVAARVGQPRGPAGADLVVDPDVVAVAGQPAEVGGVAGHVGDPRAAVDEHHRGGPGPPAGWSLGIGDPRPGRQVPEPLPGDRGRRAPGVAHRHQDRGREHHDAGQGPGAEGGQAGPAPALGGPPPGGQHHPGGEDGQEHHQPGAQEHRRPPADRRRPGQGQEPGDGGEQRGGQRPHPSTTTPAGPAAARPPRPARLGPPPNLPDPGRAVLTLAG
jgi:hypothetical protein